MKVRIFSIFPEVFPGTLGVSVGAKAIEGGFLQLEVVNFRDFATDNHKSVDDYPLGGGAGMLIKPEVLAMAVDFWSQRDLPQNLPERKPLILIMSARGYLFTQKLAAKLAELYHRPNKDVSGGWIDDKWVYIICGRFEGIDQRFIELYNAIEVSIGNFVLLGGEVAAMLILEAVVRLLPGVLGNAKTTEEESFSVGTAYENLMEYPHYTQPRSWRGLDVPEVLLSGHHARIATWRASQAQKVTIKYQVQPDFDKLFKP